MLRGNIEWIIDHIVSLGVITHQHAVRKNVVSHQTVRKCFLDGRILFPCNPYTGRLNGPFADTVEGMTSSHNSVHIDHDQGTQRDAQQRSDCVVRRDQVLGGGQGNHPLPTTDPK